MVDIIILVSVIGLIGIFHMLPAGRGLIQQGVKGVAFGVGVQGGKALYDHVTGGSDDNKDKDENKDKDNKETEKK